jgi:uncharacterized protein
MIHLPLFPLQLLPLPGELLPLHIFEPRYRQLLEDAEAPGFKFGILLRHKDNQQNLGSSVVLERIIRRHPGGESDIIIKCLDFFRLLNFETHFSDKLYPGGTVIEFNENINQPAGPKLSQQFESFQAMLRNPIHSGVASSFQIANALHLDIKDRIAFAELSPERRINFLSGRIEYEIKLAEAAKRSSNVFHLN